ncbi:MAG: DUF349 domain-containing protein [Paludibacteraceae bacterium]|nr:DUF349 domain-containing protein [Paludibacteraceae bacterium]
MDILDQKDSQQVQDETLNVAADQIENQGDNIIEECEEDSDVNVVVEDFSSLSLAELVSKAKSLTEGEFEEYAPLKANLDSIKHFFYKQLRLNNEESKKKFLEEGGVEEDFKAPVEPLEAELKSVLSAFREKRNAELQRIEKEKNDNLAAKNRILEGLKELLSNAEDFGKKIPAFQKLQQEWKEVGQVPASDVADLWKNYQLCVEQFYDNLKINNELREYDFKKNLESKTNLCEQAEALAEVSDVVEAFKKLQALHDEWREVGPVSKENREPIWNRFKAASTVVNKRHHDYFDALREERLNNLAKKTALCEKVEAVDITSLSSYKDWQDQTDAIVEIQGEWKKIGFAPSKNNEAIYERFRAACDKFFNAKNDFYKDSKEKLAANLEKKIAFCEKAEALKDSEDWKGTTDKLVQLQKEWKTIGAVPKKHSDAVWKRFVAACDYFFERKNEQQKALKNDQEENLKKKKALIGQIKAIEIGEDHNEAYKTLKGLIAEWNEVGHVPFRDKDKIYKEYKAAIDEKFDKLNLDQAARRMDVFKSNLEEMAEKGQQKLLGERKRLVRLYDSLSSDIATAENNIGFFSANSKGAVGLIKEMERKIEKLKEERNLVLEKIKMLEDTVK